MDLVGAARARRERDMQRDGGPERPTARAMQEEFLQDEYEDLAGLPASLPLPRGGRQQRDNPDLRWAGLERTHGGSRGMGHVYHAASSNTQTRASQRPGARARSAHVNGHSMRYRCGVVSRAPNDIAT